jgi:Cu(I)/Ag(I) efflux system membrane fusion protein
MGFVFAVASPVRASEPTKAIVASYLHIHAALSSDKVDGVKAAAEAIGKEAARMGAAGDAIQKAAKAVASAGNLEAVRTAFGPLSDAVIAAARADGWKDLPSLKLGYCPMVKQSWIQKDGKVSNPYYGSAMLTCGELKDTSKDAKK